MVASAVLVVVAKVVWWCGGVVMVGVVAVAVGGESGEWRRRCMWQTQGHILCPRRRTKPRVHVGSLGATCMVSPCSGDTETTGKAPDVPRQKPCAPKRMVRGVRLANSGGAGIGGIGESEVTGIAL